MNAVKNSNSSVFCFGELLLRFSPSLNGQWIRQSVAPVYIGGAELNVASALANWNIPVRYSTALPDNFLGKEIIQEIQSRKIDTSFITFSGNRIGIYYLSQGADLKSTNVIYDREGSSFSELKTGMIDWDKALKDCNWFHFSAISPALNENVALVCKEALEAAAAKGLMISVDLNYRSKLWQYGKSPKEIMPDLVKYCQVIMGNIWSVDALLGTDTGISSSNGESKKRMIAAAGENVLLLKKRYRNALIIVYTFRLEKEYWALLYSNHEEMVVSESFPISNVVDKAGSGDCFMASVIYGYLNGYDRLRTVNFATAAATGKLSEPGDSTRQTVEQIKARLK